jgi:hypothetical protein
MAIMACGPAGGQVLRKRSALCRKAAGYRAQFFSPQAIRHGSVVTCGWRVAKGSFRNGIFASEVPTSTDSETAIDRDDLAGDLRSSCGGRPVVTEPNDFVAWMRPLSVHGLTAVALWRTFAGTGAHCFRANAVSTVAASKAVCIKSYSNIARADFARGVLIRSFVIMLVCVALHLEAAGHDKYSVLHAHDLDFGSVKT